MGVTTHNWPGCYDLSWKGLIVPEAFAHPAKFSRGLIERIVRHGLTAGWWRAGDLIGDPFGGVALGGIVCGYHGLNWVGVELEEKFVELGERNVALHRGKWAVLGASAGQTRNRVTLIQGDSRRFAEIVGTAAAVVTSPPYAESMTQGNDSEQYAGSHYTRYGGGGQLAWPQKYGTAPGQIGTLKSGDLAAVLTSPPYAASNQDYANGYRYVEADEKRIGRQGDANYGAAPGQIGALKSGDLAAVVNNSGGNTTASCRMTRHERTTKEQSPAEQAGSKSVGRAQGRDRVAVPQSELVAGEDGGVLRRDAGRTSEGDEAAGDRVAQPRPAREPASPVQAREGESPVSRDGCEGQVPDLWGDRRPLHPSQERRPLRQPAGEPRNPLQPLPHAADETEVACREAGRSADTEEQWACRVEPLNAVITSPPFEDCGVNLGGVGDTPAMRQQIHNSSKREQAYGGTDGQIGNSAGETYWEAVAKVYEQCRLALRPGGILVVVVKDYVSKGKRVPLSDQTLELLTHLGFEPVERIHAMLVKERRHNGLFHEVVERTERKSFFRRLAEKKGSPAIDHEDVLIVRNGPSYA